MLPLLYLQKWPKAIEIVAPFLFYGLIPAAYLATQITYKTVFIIINYWFVFWQIIFWVGLKRNFMQEYLEDWNPQRVSGKTAEPGLWPLP